MSWTWPQSITQLEGGGIKLEPLSWRAGDNRGQRNRCLALARLRHHGSEARLCHQVALERLCQDKIGPGTELALRGAISRHHDEAAAGHLVELIVLERAHMNAGPRPDAQQIDPKITAAI